MQEEIKAILPSQYVGKWKNEEGVPLRIVLYVDLDELELKKLFIPLADFKEMQVKSFLGSDNVILTVGEDDEGRSKLLAIAKD